MLKFQLTVSTELAVSLFRDFVSLCLPLLILAPTLVIGVVAIAAAVADRTLMQPVSLRRKEHC